MLWVIFSKFKRRYFNAKTKILRLFRDKIYTRRIKKLKTCNTIPKRSRQKLAFEVLNFFSLPFSTFLYSSAAPINGFFCATLPPSQPTKSIISCFKNFLPQNYSNAFLLYNFLQRVRVERVRQEVKIGI